jgi:hypothetical protein
MPKKKSTKKKGTRSFNHKGITGTQEFDYATFSKAFDTWKNECAVSGDSLGLTTDITLLDIIKNHGVISRPYTKKKVSKDKGAGTIIDMLENWEEDATVLEEVDKLAIDRILKKLDDMRDSETDPRNIAFTVPKPNEVDEDTGEYDENDVTNIYGHYRTDDYIEFRKILSDIPGSKIREESIAAVSPDWYNTGKNTAEPPMWQALFANGNGDIVSKGLYEICLLAKKLIKNAKVTNVIIPINDTTKGMLAKDVYKLPDVKRWLMEKVGTTTNPGLGINPKNMHWKDRPMHNEMLRTKFDTSGLKESEFIKKVADFEEISGTLKTFQLDITRRQVRKLSTLTGICKLYAGRDVVYHIAGKKRLETKSKKKGVKKQWIDILGKQS